MKEKLAAALEAAKRYVGYTRFVAPYWLAYVTWLSEHPNTTGVIVLLLALFGIR